jgi:spore germination cell wall hydrolase CwlJ-like protein
MPIKFGSYFPFRRNNRKPDGTWDAPDATDENIKGTSLDPYEPMWPRWKQTPPPHGEGEFISHEPFFDIDEISQKSEFYPPGRPLVDKNVDGNPASRQRVGDMPGGNLWRRRLLVARAREGEPYPELSDSNGPEAAEMRALQLAGVAPSQSRPGPRAPAARPQTDFNDNDVDLLARLIFAEASGQFRAPGAYLGVGNTVLNRVKSRGFPKTLQDVILERAPNGVPQFASVGGRLWNSAANPGALTRNDAIAYQAARTLANDLLYGSEYNFEDPTGGATYFYSSGTNTPPPGFFSSRINSGRLRKTYEAGRPQYGDIFTCLKDTQP